MCSGCARIFHYALRPGGYLVLGASETGDDADLFRTEDKKLALYSEPTGRARILACQCFRSRAPNKWRRTAEEAVPQSTRRFTSDVGGLCPAERPRRARRPVVYLSEQAGRYLVHPGGSPRRACTKLVREELRSSSWPP